MSSLRHDFSHDMTLRTVKVFAYCVLMAYVDVIVFIWCIQMSATICYKQISPQGQINVSIHLKCKEQNPPPAPPCPSQLWCNTLGSPVEINTARSPEHSRFTGQSNERQYL